MVKGTTRQVVVVKGSDISAFDQAIFLVRDDVLSKGGISEDALLKQARQACSKKAATTLPRNLLWFSSGAAAMGLLWLLISFLA